MFNMISGAIVSTLYLPTSIMSILSLNTASNVFSTILLNFNFSSFSYTPNVNSKPLYNSAPNLNFESNNIAPEQSQLYSQIDSSSNSRNNLFNNPVISYDYKCGHYLGL